MERITSIAGVGEAAIPLRFRRWRDHPSPGIDYPDLSPLVTDAIALRHVSDALGRRLAPDTSVIAGIDVGGLGIAGALAYRNGLGLLDIRMVDAIRAGVIRSIMENYELGEGVAVSRSHGVANRAVAIADDCLMSGRTALAAIGLLRRLGARCDTAVFVFELEGMSGRAQLEDAGVAVHSLLRLPQSDPDDARPEAATGALPA